jgi:hypothetical protein
MTKVKQKHNDVYTHKMNSRIQASNWNKYLGLNEYKQRRITWGKHVNWMIKDLPIDYLKWLIVNTQDIQWAEWFARELKSRDPMYK